MKPALSIFASPSPEGTKLAEAAQALGEKLGYAAAVADPRLVDRATLCDAAVVFDGSVDVPARAYRYSALPPGSGSPSATPLRATSGGHGRRCS